MEIPKFSGDEDTYEINPKEWLSMIKKNYLSPFREDFYFLVRSSKWWNNFDDGTRFYSTWETFEEHFSNKWIGYSKWMRCIKFKWNQRNQMKMDPN
jgi:hypothetical protein